MPVANRFRPLASDTFVLRADQIRNWTSTSVTFKAPPHSTNILCEPWAVRDAAEWEQNQAGRSSGSRSGLRESFARPETAHFTFPITCSLLQVLFPVSESNRSLPYPDLP